MPLKKAMNCGALASILPGSEGLNSPMTSTQWLGDLMKAIRVGADSRPRQGQGTFEGRVANQCHQDCQRERTFPSSRAVMHCGERVRQRRAFLHDRSRGPCCPSPRSSILAYGKTLLGQHSRRPATIRCGKTSRKPPAVPQVKPASIAPDRKSTGMPSLVQGTGVDGEIMTRDGQIALWPPIIDLSALTSAAETQGKANTADQEAVLDIRNPNDFNEIDAMAVPVNTIQADDKGIWRSLILMLIAIVAFSVTISPLADLDATGKNF